MERREALLRKLIETHVRSWLWRARRSRGYRRRRALRMVRMVMGSERK